MTDYSDLVKRLRGKKLSCICAAKSASECCCNTDWPESFCNEASDALEAQAKRIAELEAMLKLSADFASKQQSLGKEFEKILFDNLDELYVVDPALEKGDGII